MDKHARLAAKQRRSPPGESFTTSTLKQTAVQVSCEGGRGRSAAGQQHGYDVILTDFSKVSVLTRLVIFHMSGVTGRSWCVYAKVRMRGLR